MSQSVTLSPALAQFAAYVTRTVLLLFGAFFLAALLTASFAPFLGLPALGWAWAASSDWDGVTTMEGLFFLFLLLPMLAPLPLAFVGFWRWLSRPFAQAASAEPAPVAEPAPSRLSTATSTARAALYGEPASDVLGALHRLGARSVALERAERALTEQLVEVRAQIQDIDRAADAARDRLARSDTDRLLDELQGRLGDALRAEREVDAHLAAK